MKGLPSKAESPEAWGQVLAWQDKSFYPSQPQLPQLENEHDYPICVPKELLQR